MDADTGEIQKRRIDERGLTEHEYNLIKSTGSVHTQADGATAYVRAINSNKYNVLIENEFGDVVTYIPGITKRELQNIGRNYGWR